MIEHIVALYAPHLCLGCQLEGELLCLNCRNELPVVADRCYRCRALSPGGRTCTSCRRQSGLHSVRTVTAYENQAKELVGKLKFSGAKAAARTIAELMAELEVPNNTVFAPVPTANARVRLRGYDQAVLIAKALAYQIDEPYLPCLFRIGQQRQVGASRQQRMQQMRGSFVVRHSSKIAGKHVVLIDDVMTTGATLEAAASVLRTAGAKRVDAMVFARA